MRHLLIILFFCISGSLFGQSLGGSGSITVSGDVRSTRGMLRQYNTWHMFGGFEDSAVVISITQNNYSTVSNVAGDLWTGISANGFSMSGDTMTIDNAGCYFGAFSVTFTAGNGNVILFQVYNVTDGAAQGFAVGATGDGDNDYVTITKPLMFHDITAGDKLIMRCTNIDASNDVTVRYGAYFLTYLHD